jgi:hypothetical protein
MESLIEQDKNTLAELQQIFRHQCFFGRRNRSTQENYRTRKYLHADYLQKAKSLESNKELEKMDKLIGEIRKQKPEIPD